MAGLAHRLEDLRRARLEDNVAHVREVRSLKTAHEREVRELHEKLERERERLERELRARREAERRADEGGRRERSHHRETSPGQHRRSGVSGDHGRPDRSVGRDRSRDPSRGGLGRADITSRTAAGGTGAGSGGRGDAGGGGGGGNPTAPRPNLTPATVAREARTQPSPRAATPAPDAVMAARLAAMEAEVAVAKTQARESALQGLRSHVRGVLATLEADLLRLAPPTLTLSADNTKVQAACAEASARLTSGLGALVASKEFESWRNLEPGSAFLGALQEEARRALTHPEDMLKVPGTAAAFVSTLTAGLDGASGVAPEAKALLEGWWAQVSQRYKIMSSVGRYAAVAYAGGMPGGGGSGGAGQRAGGGGGGDGTGGAGGVRPKKKTRRSKKGSSKGGSGGGGGSGAGERGGAGGASAGGR